MLLETGPSYDCVTILTSKQVSHSEHLNIHVRGDLWHCLAIF